MKLVANGMSSHDNNGDDKEYIYNNYDSTTLHAGESVYTPNIGEHNENDISMTDSNYVCDPIDGVCSISIDNLEEVNETEMNEDKNREEQGREVGH